VEDVGFDNTVTENGIDALKTITAEISQNLADLEIVEQWSGLRPRSADSLPMIGRLEHAEGVFAATAHYRNGILLAPVTAKAIAELIAGERNPESLQGFRPMRLRAVRTG